MTILFIIAILFLFGITVFIHELGHFVVARKCGLVVETFSIGMGPALWKTEKDGIVYKISAFPIGGYVSIPQLDPSGMEKMQGENDNDRAALPEVSPWKKIAVAFAGPLFNVLFAIPLALIVMCAEKAPDHTAIGYVSPDSVIYEQGLRAGDVITTMNGNAVASWYDIAVEKLLASTSDRIKLEYISGNTTNLIDFSTASLEEGSIGLSGVAPALRPLLADIRPNSPASAAGLKTGDLVTSINNQPIKYWHQFAGQIEISGGTETPLTVLRDKKTVALTVTPEFNKEYNKAVIGVTPGDPAGLPWAMSGGPIDQIKNDASKISRLLKALTTKGESKNAASGMGGPIAIFTMIWFALKLGLPYAIGLIRFININLAVLNLLPLPVLDGGHICFALWEGITRRKVNPQFVTTLINIFAILLIGVMLVLSARDIDRNWNVSRFFKKAPVEQVETVPAETAPAK